MVLLAYYHCKIEEYPVDFAALRKKIRHNPALLAPFIAIEFLMKRGLATILWLAWRSRVHPFMFLRGKDYTTGRFYIEHFLSKHAAKLSGTFLEFGDPHYKHFFTASQIERYDVLDVSPGPKVTIVGDLQNCPQIPDNTYDVIVCTQVLEHVPNPFLASGELYRILKPGGTLLFTVPAAYPYHAIPKDYWRFTRDSLQLLFGERFENIEITAYGNRLTVIAAYWYWMRDHMPRRALLAQDPDNPNLLAMIATKPKN